jgi:hypothetical protein
MYERLEKKPLQPSRIGPHLVIVANPMYVKVTGINPWIHHSQMKKAAAPTDLNNWQSVHDPTNPLRLRFQRMSQQHQSPERAPALIQPPPGSWLVNAWQKPEDSLVRT